MADSVFVSLAGMPHRSLRPAGLTSALAAPLLQAGCRGKTVGVSFDTKCETIEEQSGQHSFCRRLCPSHLGKPPSPLLKLQNGFRQPL